MSRAITVEEAQSHLPELIGRLAPGEEILITQDQRPVARLVGERPRAQASRTGELQGPDHPARGRRRAPEGFRIEQIPIVSVDTILDAYGVQRLW